MRHFVLLLLALQMFSFAIAQKQGTIDIKVFDFQNANYSTSGNAGSFSPVEFDLKKDTVEFWNDLSQKLIRFEISNRNIKYKMQTHSNGFTSATNTDFYLKITITRNGLTLRQEVQNFSLYPKDNQNDGKYFHIILLSEKERGMNDGKYLKIKVELYRKGEPLMLTTKSKVLFFDGGE